MQSIKEMKTLQVSRFIKNFKLNKIDNKNKMLCCFFQGNKTYASFNNLLYTTVLDRESFMIYNTLNGIILPDRFTLFELHKYCHDNNHNFKDVCPGSLMNCQTALSIDYCKRVS